MEPLPPYFRRPLAVVRRCPMGLLAVIGRRGYQCFVGAWVVFTTLSASACGNNCTRPPVGVYALRIQVVDAESGNAICDADVSIQLGDQVDKLLPRCIYSGGSRAGTYVITVKRAGYRDSIVRDVVVVADECSETQAKMATVALVPTV